MRYEWFENRFYWLPECEVCHKPFRARRQDAKTCSARCRKYKSREDDRKQTVMADLTFAAHRAREAAKTYSGSQDVLDMMILLRQSIDASLRLFNVEWDATQLPGFSPAPPAPKAKTKRVSKQQKSRYGEAAPPAPAAPAAAHSTSAASSASA